MSFFIKNLAKNLASMKLPCRQPPHLGLGCIVKTDNAQTCEFCLSLGRWGLDPPPASPKNPGPFFSLPVLVRFSAMDFVRLCPRRKIKKSL